jgi:hypothetical protein
MPHTPDHSQSGQSWLSIRQRPDDVDADQTYSGCVGSSGLFCGKSEIWPCTSIIQNSNEIGDHQMQIWQLVSYNSFLDITCTPHLEILRTPLLFLWPRKVSLLTSAQEVEVESMVASSTPSICGVLN